MKSLAILSHKGGVGKTSIAVNIAVYLASKGKRVCLIDNDFHGPSIYTFFKPNVTWINDYLLAEGKLEDCLQEFSSQLNLAGKLYIGFADPSHTSIQEVLQMDKDTSIGMLRKYVKLKNELLKPPYEIEYLIVDCSPGAVFSTINVMVATDSSLFIIKLSNADILGTSQMISALHEEMKSRTLVLANFIPEDFVQNTEKTDESQNFIEKIFTKDIGDKVVDFLGWIPQDQTLLNYEFEQALKTIRGQESSRVIFSVDQPEHIFSQTIIQLLPVLFNEPEALPSVSQDLPELLVKQRRAFVVGEPQVGKTALFHALTSGRVPEKLQSTAGIDRYTIWEAQEGNVITGINWWDFAGQYAYRDTHKLFLTEDTLYILVLNLRESIEKNHALYWLQSIREKAPKAPILPILTHYDEVGDNVLGLAASDDWQELMEYMTTYKTLEPIKVSNTEGKNITKVEQLIKRSMNEYQGVQIPKLYSKLKEYIQSCEERIFLTLEQVRKDVKQLPIENDIQLELSDSKLNEILLQLSHQGHFHIVELPSSPSIVIFDVDRVTKAFSLIIDQAKPLKGFVEEVDVLDICADYFSRGERREAAHIIADLMVKTDMALPIPTSSSTGRIISSWLIPHASEILTEKTARKNYPSIFVRPEEEIGKSLASFNFVLNTFDEIIEARVLGHLFNYLPYSEKNQVWRERSEDSEKTSLHAFLYEDDRPIVHFHSDSLRRGKIRLKVVITDDILEKGLLASIIYALSKYKISFEIEETIFIKTQKFKNKDENLLDRIAQLTNIPEEYIQTIEQAIKISSSAPSSAIVTAVTALEGLFVTYYTKKIAEPEATTKFWEILKALYDANYVPRTVKIWADTVRLHRNNCAHNINPVNTNDVNIVLEEILYVLEWYNTVSTS